MKNILLLIISILLFTSCNNSQKKISSENSRIELVPELDKAERLKYEAIQKLKKSKCVIQNPDVSLCGIELRNYESTISILGDKDKTNEFGEYHYYSNFESETLTLTQHPGDGNFLISIFKVENSNKASYGYRKLNFDSFKTQNEIELGMTKKQIIEKLGNCYAPIDSTSNYIEMYYQIETPKDSNTKILEKNNMPVYYASYKLRNNQLDKYEFGFEYP